MTFYGKVLIVDFYDFPEKIQKIVSKFENFNTNCFIEWSSELTPFYEHEKWETSLTEKKLISYYKEQTKEFESNSFEGSLEDFVAEYNLELELYLIKLNMDLKNVSLILIRT